MISKSRCAKFCLHTCNTISKWDTHGRHWDHRAVRAINQEHTPSTSHAWIAATRPVDTKGQTITMLNYKRRVPTLQTHVHSQICQCVRYAVLCSGAMKPGKWEIGPAADPSLGFQAMLEPAPVRDCTLEELVCRSAPRAIHLTADLHVVSNADQRQGPPETPPETCCPNSWRYEGSPATLTRIPEGG
jgi:hypothetical protein